MELPLHVIAVCPQHHPKPDPKYEKMKPSDFRRKLVKIGFPIPGSNSGAMEFLWVTISKARNEVLIGQLYSEPILVKNVKRGQRVLVTRDQICDMIASPTDSPTSESSNQGKSECVRSFSKMVKLLSESALITAPTSSIRAVPITQSRNQTDPAPHG